MKSLAFLAIVTVAGLAHADEQVINCYGGALSYKAGQWAVTISTGSAIIENCTSRALGGPKDRSNPLSTDATCETATKPEDFFGFGGPVKITGNAGPVYLLHNQFDKCAEKQIQIEPQMVNRTLQAPGAVYIALNRFGGYYATAADDQAQWTHAQLAAAGTTRVFFALNDCTGVFRRCALAQGPNVQLWEINNRLAFWQYPGTSGEAFRPFPIVSRGEAQVIAQGNIIVGPGKPWEAADVGGYQNAQSVEPRATGSLRAVGNTLSNGATLTEVQPEKVNLTYPFNVASPDVLPSILAHAGPQAETTK